MKLRLVATGVAIVLAAGGTAAVWKLSAGGRVTPISVDAALESYRAANAATTAAPSTTAPVAALPEPGVYVYDTSGFDTIDALGGARHDYPAVSTVAVTPTGCGVQLRWDLAKERYDTWSWCPSGPGIAQVASTAYHEFFGVAGTDSSTCTGEPRPLDAPVGTSWRWSCTSTDGTVSEATSRVVEAGPIAVAGVEVATIHVRTDIVASGGSNGTKVIDSWYRVSDGMIVRETASVDTVSKTVIGTTSFTERSTIQLRALAPQR